MDRTLLLLLITLLSVGSYAQTIHVPQDFGTIQAAINASSPGDSIHIAPGTYLENLVIPHELTFYSDFLDSQDLNDIETTILDGDSSGAVILAQQPLGTRLEFIGLTVQNGTGHPYPITDFQDTLFLNFGGGLHVIGVPELVLDHMIIRQNELLSDHNSGGGLFAEQCGVEVRDCVIEENLVQGGSFFGEGGGMCFYDCDIEIYHSLIQNNVGLPGYAEGAGIYAVNSNIFLGSVDILNNSGPNAAAFNFSASTAEMTNCNVIGNVAGFTNVFRFHSYNQNTEFVIEDCLFSENQGHQGGTFNINSAQAIISGTTFENNSTTFGPVCLNIAQSDFAIDQCSFIGGFCGEGSSLSCDAGALKTWQSSGTVRNTIMKNNIPGTSSGSSAEGGAMDLGQSEILLDSVIVQGNMASDGGGIRAYGSDITMLHSALLDNEGDQGGAIFTLDCTWRILNSTIAGNSASDGDGVWTYSDSLRMVNSILWNEAGDEVHGHVSQFNDTSTIDIAYSTVRGLDAHFSNQDLLETTWHAGNTADAPVFVDPLGGDYQLLSNSPQVDAGTSFFALNGEVLVDTQDYLGIAPDMGYAETMTTGLEEDREDLFSVFPNPVGSELYLIGPVLDIEQVQLFDMQGRSVATDFAWTNVLAVGALSPGVYHLQVQHTSGMESLTLVKE